VNITEVKVNGVVVFSGSQASVEINIEAGAMVSWKTSGLHDCVLVEDCVATTSPDYCMQATLYNVKLLYGFVTRSAAIAHALEKAKHSG